MSSVSKIVRNRGYAEKSCDSIIEHAKLIERIRTLENQIERLHIEVVILMDKLKINKRDL